VPIIPYGSGTSLEGHTLADHGGTSRLTPLMPTLYCPWVYTELIQNVVRAGIALDFTRFMNKVLKVHVEDMDVVVQPGLRREELNEYARLLPSTHTHTTHTHTHTTHRGAQRNLTCVFADVNSHLKQYNLFFPLDPGPSASLGGMVGTSCSGTHAVRYGTMKENILRYVIPRALRTLVARVQPRSPFCSLL
jgi:D-lactate dehydrogenase (cytochrome)